MPNSKIALRQIAILVVLAIALATFACADEPVDPAPALPGSLSEVPAVRLSYRYEADVPPPTQDAPASEEERLAALRLKFQQERPGDFLARTIGSPDGKRVAIVYNQAGDQPEDYRLDMYSSEGTLISKVTSELMAVHFPDTIAWSPDSSSLAFVAMLRSAPALDDRGQPIAPGQSVPAEPAEDPANIPAPEDPAAANGNVNTEPVSAEPTPEAPAGILTFRTEQLYLTDANGTGTRPLTQNESLIYYYYVWSSDSAMLATLASTVAEWQYVKRQAEAAGEVFVPAGRPRVVEKNGRERLLDDALTTVQPVWSPDSTKIAAAFDKQIRIYDAGGTVPTQAAIPLRNNLLISSRDYDMQQAGSLTAANTESAANTSNAASNTGSNANRTTASATLPDANTLVSFNPIVALYWSTDDQLYFQTAFIKRMLNQADSVSSFPRWHRLILAPQAVTQ